MARPSKIEEFDEERRQKFFKLLERGNFREVAAAAVGITNRTLRRWLKAAAEGDERYQQFADDLEESEAKAEALLVEIIRIAAHNHNVQAAQWILERRGAKRWTVKKNMELTVDDDGDGGKVEVHVHLKTEGETGGGKT